MPLELTNSTGNTIFLLHMCIFIQLISNPNWYDAVFDIVYTLSIFFARLASLIHTRSFINDCCSLFNELLQPPLHQILLRLQKHC